MCIGGISPEGCPFNFPGCASQFSFRDRYGGSTIIKSDVLIILVRDNGIFSEDGGVDAGLREGFGDGYNAELNCGFAPDRYQNENHPDVSNKIFTHDFDNDLL
jgi:hypothetical protein